MADTNVRPKDGPYEGCDWPIRKSFRRIVRPKDVIDRYKSPSERRSVRRILIGQDEDVFMKIVRRSVRRILIERDKDVVLEIVQSSVRRILIGRDEATCPYDDASDLSSCQTDLIRREGILVLSFGTLMIGRSDGFVLMKRF